ncbi:MAG: prepilin-type N-terminal cleavage/methylation domain-containing protein [Candidatus Niyogibacteria bacterium]|nr:prepilin-type N-terminal cleavage/methylation domain-containing protein [Candidatus Niyogibacteria bacterium]
MNKGLSYGMKAGFTLLETLVALAVLSLALAGALTLASMGVRSASSSFNQSSAFFLASEAVEYVRNIRDSNILTGEDWLLNLRSCLGADCVVDATKSDHASALSVCAGACPVLRVNSSSGLYSQNSADSAAIFTRVIRIEEVVVGREAKITSTVSWQQGSVPRSFVIEERLFNLAF